MTKALFLEFEQTNFLSNVEGAACNTNTDITRPAGLALDEKDGCVRKIYAVANTSQVVVLDTCGKTAANTISTSSSINGALFDVSLPECCKGFDIESNGLTGCSRLLAAYDGGYLAGFNRDVNVLFTLPGVSLGLGFNFSSLAYYDKHIYAVVESEQVIRKYDRDWNLVDTFTDQGLVDAGYGPYGIRVVCVKGKQRLAVTFIPPGANSSIGDYAEEGFGYVDFFRSDGTFKRFINRGALTVPISCFDVEVEGRKYIGVSNRGNGRINFFDECGNLVAPARDKKGNILSIDGLYYVAADPKKAVLYFTALSADATQGTIGRLTLV